jgi:hypothetical protein
MRKPIVVLDFDGVLHSYSSGWKGIAEIADGPTEGLANWLQEASKHFRLVVYSSRSGQEPGLDAMKVWWVKWGLPACVEFWKEKPPAFVTIDDRALTFTGKWSDFPPERLLSFKPWNAR